jgi:dUTP pyrophosphatase
MKLLLEKISDRAKLPIRAHTDDAGLDLYALDEAFIRPHEWALIGTGIRIALPANTVGLIWDKSGLAANGLHCLAGVIDEGYRGEIIVNVLNLNKHEYKINAGEKIAQLLIQPILYPEIVEAKVDENTERGIQGFGSTGLV